MDQNSRSLLLENLSGDLVVNVQALLKYSHDKKNYFPRHMEKEMTEESYFLFYYLGTLVTFTLCLVGRMKSKKEGKVRGKGLECT